MRSLFIAMLMGGLAQGCVTPRAPVVPEVSAEVEQWRRRYEEGRAREEALGVRLAAVESMLEALAQERAETAQLTRLWEDERVRAAAERHVLSEHNAQLMSRQREQEAIQEELEDVWYQVALSRARRRGLPETSPEPVPPPLAPSPRVAPAVSP